MVFRHNPSSKILGEMPLDEVLEFALSHGRSTSKITHEGRKYAVGRMRVFAVHGCKCSFCGLEGTKIILTQDAGGSLHLDLYAEKNRSYVLMNRDHIKPASLGGSNSIWNMRPTCAPCNSKRGNNYSQTDIALFQFRSKVEMSYGHLRNMRLTHQKAYKLCNRFAHLPPWVWNVAKKFVPQFGWSMISKVAA